MVNNADIRKKVENEFRISTRQFRLDISDQTYYYQDFEDACELLDKYIDEYKICMPRLKRTEMCLKKESDENLECNINIDYIDIVKGTESFINSEVETKENYIREVLYYYPDDASNELKRAIGNILTMHLVDKI
jgi:hypothetical protein